MPGSKFKDLVLRLYGHDEESLAKAKEEQRRRIEERARKRREAEAKAYQYAEIAARVFGNGEGKK